MISIEQAGTVGQQRNRCCPGAVPGSDLRKLPSQDQDWDSTESVST